jgi:putative phosphoserine phosphatase/1-acylglycerol-3-phosphate O-acyltransferase
MKRAASVSPKTGRPRRSSHHEPAGRNAAPGQWLGTGLAYGAMLPAVFVGQVVRMLTGSARAGADLTMSTWADFSAQAIALDLSIEGREHLWSSRPAVFIFNHQSAVDAVIIAKLLRENFAGIGKAELRNHPIAGPMFKAAGVVFIERADREKAIKALQPAVEALRQGTSLSIAPEGTRSRDGQLGPFKKGAFHIAMQAGVPIVPIVIKNSVDAQRKGEMLFRPATVQVVVLPPVDTRKWRVATLDRHVSEVRAIFLRSLRQPVASRRAPRRSGSEDRPAARGSSASSVPRLRRR